MALIIWPVLINMQLGWFYMFEDFFPPFFSILFYRFNLDVFFYNIIIFNIDILPLHRESADPRKP